MQYLTIFLTIVKWMCETQNGFILGTAGSIIYVHFQWILNVFLVARVSMWQYLLLCLLFPNLFNSLPLYLRKFLRFLFMCYPLIQTFASLFCSDISVEASFSQAKYFSAENMFKVACFRWQSLSWTFWMFYQQKLQTLGLDV